MRKSLVYVLFLLLIAGFTLLATEQVYAQTDGSNPGYVRGITSGRAQALAGGVVGLISLVMGLRANMRSVAGTDKARSRATWALVLGVAGAILSILHLCISAGAVFGSGSGKAGAIVGLILSLTGTTFGGLILRKKNK